MIMQVKVSKEEIAKMVAEYIQKKLGIQVDPNKVTAIYTGSYDEAEFEGMQAEILSE
jgi:hypothetical protein